MAIKDLGAVTAYAYAVQHGYTGTEAEFEEFMALLPQRVNDAQDKIDEIAAFNVEVSTGAAGSQASASYNHSNSKLSLMIPRGDTGEISQEFVDENLAYNDGYYEEMSVGGADQIITDIQADDDNIYTFRTTGGSLDVGDRKTEELVGGTVAWNQRENIPNSITSAGLTITKDSNGVVSLSGVPTNTYVAVFGYGKGYKDHVVIVCNRIIANPNNLSIKIGALNTSAYTGDGGKIVKLSADVAYDSYGLQNLSTSSDYTGVKFTTFACDLTQMFGTTIADAIYAMEQAEAGAGVAWFKKYFPKPYYAYNAGSLQSVNVAAGINTGFNQWDEEWEQGAIANASGNNTSQESAIRSKYYIPVIGGITYFINKQSSNLRFYDADKNYLGSDASIAVNTNTFVVPSNASFMRFYVSNYGTTYNHDICINISWDGSRDGEYEPYDTHVYNYDSDLQLRGIPSLDEFGNLVYDGDIYKSDGTVQRKYGIVDLGTLTWAYSDGLSRFSSASLQSSIKRNSGYSPKAMCAKYPVVVWGTAGTNLWLANDGTIYIKDTAYTDAATFKTAMSGVYFVYELATPTTESADSFTSPQIINDFGTEEWIDAGMTAATPTRDVLIPPGHNSAYMVNLKAKLEMAPNSPDGDGEYLVRQRNGENEYVPFSWTGDHLDLTAGSAHQLISTIQTNDQTPYLFRTSGGSVDIGDREYINGIVGGTVAWNQLVENGDFNDGVNGWEFQNVPSSMFTFTASNGVGKITILDNSSEAHRPNPRTVNEPTIVTGHKYLLTTDLKVTSATNKLFAFLFGNYFAFPNAITPNSWHRVSMIKEVTALTYSRFYLYGNAYFAGYNVGDTIEYTNAMVIDLTQMFGSTIADYIYSLEQATAGAGVAWFKKLFPKPYYAYNAGELKSVSGLVSHDMTGFNQWDEEWEAGSIDGSTGQNESSSSNWRSKNYVKVLPNTTYYVYSSSATKAIRARFYDANKGFIGTADGNGYNVYTGRTFLSPNNAYYMRFAPATSDIPNHDICINISWDGSRDGEYEPYVKHSYPLDSDVTLRGKLMLDANNSLYYDGDTYESDGTVTRKYGVVDLGTLDWFKVTSGGATFFYAGLSGGSQKDDFSGICGKYPLSQGASWSLNDKVCRLYGSTGYNFSRIGIIDSVYTSGSESAFKTAMSGVYLVYELATPTTESADPYQQTQIVDDFGTEEFVTTSIVPVGHDTNYPINLVAKVEMAPNSPDGNGDYVVQQTNGTNEYIALASTATIQNILSRLEALEGNE